ncbi:MAG: hypothetical protein OXC25_02775 [Thiotrichales bacterium]|nr:hypothetical protein [Thiotrichales bacterium]
MTKTMAVARNGRQERIAAYKTTLRGFIDQRPSGIRRRIAEVTGTHKSFISQLTNPSDTTPLPARHIDAIFAVCHLSPEEQRTFLAQYHRAHPEPREHAERRDSPRRHTRTLHLRIPVIEDEKKQKALESLIRDTARRLFELVD